MENTKGKANIPVIVLRAVLIAAALAVFAVYAKNSLAERPFYDLIGPFFALFLFAFVLIAAAPRVIALLKGEDEFPRPKSEGVMRRLLTVMLAALVLHVFTLVLGMLAYSLMYPGESAQDVFRNAWMKQNTDAGHYVTIARDWYVSEDPDNLLIVFFPMLPVLIRALNTVFHDGYISAQLINLAVTPLLAGTAYLTFRGPLGERRAVCASFITLLMPGAIFFNSPMTEPLFLLFTFASFLSVQKKRFLLAGVFAALSGFTRSLGVLAAVPLALTGINHVVGLAREKKDVTRTLILLLAGLFVSVFGTLGYLFINWRVHGDPLKFLEYQASNWSQRACPFFDTVRYIINPYLIKSVQELNADNAVVLWGSQLFMIFGALIIMIFAAKKLPAAYTVYFLCYFAVSVGCTWLLSSVRYLSACLPLAAALGLFCDKKAKTAALFSVLGVLYAAYLLAYMARCQVY